MIKPNYLVFITRVDYRVPWRSIMTDSQVFSRSSRPNSLKAQFELWPLNVGNFKNFVLTQIGSSSMQNKGAHWTSTTGNTFPLLLWVRPWNSNSPRSTTHFLICFTFSCSIQFKFTLSENAKKPCEYRTGWLFLDRLTATHPALHRSAFTLVSFDIVRTRLYGSLDKSLIWSVFVNWEAFDFLEDKRWRNFFVMCSSSHFLPRLKKITRHNVWRNLLNERRNSKPSSAGLRNRRKWKNS